VNTETHVAGVGGVMLGATAIDQLTVLLNGWHGFDEPHAGAAAWWIVSAGMALYGLMVWFVSWRWPTLPPFPHQGE
jgi:hypothetical protein